MTVTLNPNTFEQSQIPGDLDLNIAMTGTISGLISANQATALAEGTPVKLDAAILTGRLPQFVAAAAGDLAIGYLRRTLRQTSFAAGDTCEVTMMPAPVMWLTAKGTVAMGAQVESDATDPTLVQTLASASCRGIALDPATDGKLLRVILNTAPLAHA